MDTEYKLTHISNSELVREIITLEGDPATMQVYEKSCILQVT